MIKEKTIRNEEWLNYSRRLNEILDEIPLTRSQKDSIVELLAKLEDVFSRANE